MLKSLKQKTRAAYLALAMILLFALPAAADDTNSVSIGAGLNTTSVNTIAGTIKNIALGAAGLTGVMALVALLWVGLKYIWGHTEKQRAEGKEHLIDIFKGLGIAGLSSMIVGFAAWLIQQNVH